MPTQRMSGEYSRGKVPNVVANSKEKKFESRDAFLFSCGSSEIRTIQRENIRDFWAGELAHCGIRARLLGQSTSQNNLNSSKLISLFF